MPHDTDRPLPDTHETPEGRPPGAIPDADRRIVEDIDKYVTDLLDIADPTTRVRDAVARR